MYQLLLLIFLYFTACCDVINAQGTTNFVVEKFEPCEEVRHQKVNITVVLKTFTPGKQLMDISIITPIPLDNKLRFSMRIEIEIPHLRQWQYLLGFEDDFCRIIQIYLGELLYELETAVAIPRRSCPVSRGHYHAVNYTMDYTKMKLQTFPYGRIRTKLQFLEVSTRNVVQCSIVVASNKV